MKKEKQFGLALLALCIILFVFYKFRNIKPETPHNTEIELLYQKNDSLEKLTIVQLQTIDSLKKARKKLGEELVLIKLQKSKLQINYTQIKDVIQHLPSDSSIVLLQSKLSDTTQISGIKYNKKQKVLITPKQVTEINLNYASVDYYLDYINSLQSEMDLMSNSDSLCNGIIAAYDSILLNNNVLLQNKDKEIDSWQKENKDLKKNLKNQKMKFFGASGVAAILMTILLVK